MPRRPTSTPTPSHSNRMMNIIMTGLLCASSQQDGPGPTIFPPPAFRGNLVAEPGTLENERLFLFARNLLYLHVFFHVGRVATGLRPGRSVHQRGISLIVTCIAPTPSESDTKRSV